MADRFGLQEEEKKSKQLLWISLWCSHSHITTESRIVAQKETSIKHTGTDHPIIIQKINWYVQSARDYSFSCIRTAATDMCVNTIFRVLQHCWQCTLLISGHMCFKLLSKIKVHLHHWYRCVHTRSHSHNQFRTNERKKSIFSSDVSSLSWHFKHSMQTLGASYTCCVYRWLFGIHSGWAHFTVHNLASREEK